jgi:hypothetical protein
MRTPAPKRPYIPIAVKLEVALRQLRERGEVAQVAILLSPANGSLGTRLKLALQYLGFEKSHLDHMPALALRHRNKRTGRYTPDANDPDYLQWIEAADHLTKTAGRGGEKMRVGGDTREAAKTKRLESRRSGVPSKKRKTKWPKGQKIRSRGFR